MSKSIQLRNINNEKYYPHPYYPVGSIYLSVTNTNPTKWFGGTWEQIAKGRTLIGVNTSDSDFSTVKKTGGSKEHNHLYGLQYGGYYRDVSLEQNSNAGLLDYSNSSSYTVTGGGSSVGSKEAPINNNSTTSNKNVSMGHYKIEAHTSKPVSLPPYFTCYIWCRTA